MGLFNDPDINSGVEKFNATPSAVLLDVRTHEEFREERIPKSRNIPLEEIEEIIEKIPDKTTPLFIYCHSGARSELSVSYLKRIGYENVVSIGGIADYTGDKERG